MNHLTVASKIGGKVTLMKDDIFAERYIQLKKKEGRMYSDEEVARLPVIDKDHSIYPEWLVRKNSCKKLLNYIRQKNTSPNILEIGCGNGWLTARLAEVTTGNATGLDINHSEIEQARRVFGNISNCNFVEGNINSGILGDQKFDFIVFASSIQYFKSLKDILNLALDHLTLQGEIHIIDTMFYEYTEIAGAQEKSRNYYNSMGLPEMAAHYYHHFIDNLEVFQWKILFDPHSFMNKFIRERSPYYWIAITNRYR